MTTEVKVTCPACGHVRLAAREIRLVLGASSYYLFTCPGCGDRVRRPAPQPVLELLQRAGVFGLG